MTEVRYRWVLFVPVLLVYFLGMFVGIMEVDAAQYAAMSLEMNQMGEYLELYYRGVDYIDKPPLLFWVTSLSFKLFGVSNFSYKLPSVLFTLLGLFATYRLGRMLYGQSAAFYAALLLATCQAWFLINNDVRTDTILVACIVFGVWQVAEYTASKRWQHLLLGGVGIAGAMMTKGPIGIMVPALAFGTDFALSRQWASFFKPDWGLLLVVIGLLLAPMLYGLYTQFDLSDGRPTYNGLITSGLRFYFWTQSFGRLTGESQWVNETDPFYFVHSYLWSFLPWSILGVAGLVRVCRKLFSDNFRLAPGEGILLGGILLPFVAFSFSRYQLPHYIYVCFPLVAILAGHELEVWTRRSEGKGFAAMKAVHQIIAEALVLFALLMVFYVFPTIDPLIIAVCATGAIAMLLACFITRRPALQLFLPSLLAILTVNFTMNVVVYPALLKYQSESQAVHWVHSSSNQRLVGFRAGAYCMDFLYQRPVPTLRELTEFENMKGEVWVYTTPEGLEMISGSRLSIHEKIELPDFHVTTLTLQFVNPQTRPLSLDKRYLLRVRL